MTQTKNIFGEPLVPCSFNPLTGYFRDGCCRSGDDDIGTHVVCAVMTNEFLMFSQSRGNDLVTPRPAMGFAGLKPGDQWCVCVNRWIEAYQANSAPWVALESTNHSALKTIERSLLERFAYRSDDS